MQQHSIATNRSISNHATIVSQTRYAYPFARTKRFPNNHAECPEAFYTFDSQLSNRRAGMGYGQKSDFTKTLTASPPSTRYNQKSIFEGEKGLSFGCAREKSPDRSYLIPQIHRNPGPGQYENQVATLMPQKYSLRAKTIDVIDKQATNHQTPGPAAYQAIELENGNGRHQVSKFEDTRFAKIEPNRPRFPGIKQSPGPSTYEQAEGWMEKGKYTHSKHTGHGSRAFDKEARFTFHHWKPSSNPGPGRYEAATEFPLRP